MNESVAFAEKYLSKKGALVDANVLLVYLFGQTAPHLLERSHRTQQYAKDYPVVRKVVEACRVIHTTPNVLTEVSSLNGKPSSARRRLHQVFIEKSIPLLWAICITNAYSPFLLNR